MNVKPNDIAIVTTGYHAGKIGTVIELWTPGVPIDGRRFLNSPPELAPFWVFEAAGEFISSDGRRAKRGPFPDSWLKPVSGLPLTDLEEVCVK